MTLIARLMTIALFLPNAVLAEMPKVVTDIAPVHSLVADLMQGVGTPDLLIPPGSEPHDYALRPSDARALQDADLVVWVGPALTPTLGDTIARLARDAGQIALLSLPDTVRYNYDDAAVFSAEDRGHEQGEHDGGIHDEGLDPHAWLDPANAQVWVQVIATRLARMDPANATIYDTNAQLLQAALSDLTARTQATMAPLKDKRFLVFHDAYQYFETRFGLRATGALLESDATQPSAARLAALRAELERAPVECLFTEAQVNDKVSQAVTGGAEIHTATLDPTGIDQGPGPQLYLRLIEQMADQFATCLAGNG